MADALCKLESLNQIRHELEPAIRAVLDHLRVELHKSPWWDVFDFSNVNFNNQPAAIVKTALLHYVQSLEGNKSCLSSPSLNKLEAARMLLDLFKEE